MAGTPERAADNAHPPNRPSRTSFCGPVPKPCLAGLAIFMSVHTVRRNTEGLLTTTNAQTQLPTRSCQPATLPLPPMELPPPPIHTSASNASLPPRMYLMLLCRFCHFCPRGMTLATHPLVTSSSLDAGWGQTSLPPGLPRGRVDCPTHSMSQTAAIYSLSTKYRHFRALAMSL
jgi:hypothetical protein